MAEKPVARLYRADGVEQGEIDLAAEVFGVEPNTAVMHQVVTAQLAAARSGTASTKSRSEVRGGGSKPWRQKGLGRARHGSIRSPQWRGGGVAFGPRPRSYAQRTPTKMKRLALRSALSVRSSEGRVKVIEGFEWTTPKTKAAKALLETIGADGKVLVVLGSADAIAEHSFHNLPRVITNRIGQLNSYDVLWADTVLFTTAALEAADSRSYEVSDDDFVREEEGSS